MNLAKKRILALMGCALFLALAAGFIFFFRGRSPSDAYALQKADYPQMASHPKGSASSRKWDAWQESLQLFSRKTAMSVGWRDFFKKASLCFSKAKRGKQSCILPSMCIWLWGCWPKPPVEKAGRKF